MSHYEHILGRAIVPFPCIVVWVLGIDVVHVLHDRRRFLEDVPPHLVYFVFWPISALQIGEKLSEGEGNDGCLHVYDEHINSIVLENLAKNLDNLFGVSWL